MTSALAAIGLTYDGTDLQDPAGIFLEVTRGLFETGDTRGVDVTVPGLDGQVVRPRRFHERRIQLAGFVRGDGLDQATRRADFWNNLDILRALFDETGLPKPTVAIMPDGTTRTCDARTLPDGRIVVEQVQSEFATVSIEMVALEDWTIEITGS